MRMEASVLVLRVLNNATTSVIVRVLSTNAVLQCNVCAQSTGKLQADERATVRFVAYKPPFVTVAVYPHVLKDLSDFGDTEDTATDSPVHCFESGRAACNTSSVAVRKRRHFTSLLVP